MKRLMINEIMRRGNSLYDSYQSGGKTEIEFYEELCFGYEDKQGGPGQQTEEQIRVQRDMNQDSRYFEELSHAVVVEFDKVALSHSTHSKKEKVVKRLQVLNFILRINYVDRMLTAYKVPILELALNGTLITANECLVLAANVRASQLRSLDLSCNPISVLGLLHLIDPRTSELRALQTLTLIDCDID